MKVPSILDHVDDEAGRERVSAELGPLLTAVYAEAIATHSSLPRLHASLKNLLSFLASPAGRTNANCVAADSFFMHNDRWERSWEHLPEPYQDILGFMGEALHDTVSAPDIAENFSNRPEDLLDQLARIESRPTVV